MKQSWRRDTLWRFSEKPTEIGSQKDNLQCEDPQRQARLQAVQIQVHKLPVRVKDKKNKIWADTRAVHATFIGHPNQTNTKLILCKYPQN